MSAAAHCSPVLPHTAAALLPCLTYVFYNLQIQIRSLKNGEVYRGGIVKGAKAGFGQFEYGNGDVYDGQFDADSMHGYGVYTFATGGLFQGQVRH